MGDHALADTGDEARRLMDRRHTSRRTLQASGVAAGARVLDLGAGIDDVSLIAGTPPTPTIARQSMDAIVAEGALVGSAVVAASSRKLV